MIKNCLYYLFTFFLFFSAYCKQNILEINSIQGLWVESQYFDCINTHKSLAKCANNKHYNFISIYIPPVKHQSDTLWFDVSGLHTHDFVTFAKEGEPLNLQYYNFAQMPSSIPSQKLKVSEMEGFSDSTHEAYLKVDVLKGDTLLVLTRDSIDSLWGGNQVIFRKYKGPALQHLLSTNGIHQFLNNQICGSYQVLNAKGKPKGIVTLGLDGSISTNLKKLQGKRFQMGTEFYCMPFPNMSYVIIIDLLPSRIHIKGIKESLFICNSFSVGFEWKENLLYLYQIKDKGFSLTKGKLLYILKPKP